MKTVTAALTGLAILAAASATAENAVFTPLITAHATVPSGRFDMPSPFYDELNAKLIADGYRDVRVLDANAGRLSATDAHGSEVVMIADTTARRILSWSYVHRGDR